MFHHLIDKYCRPKFTAMQARYAAKPELSPEEDQRKALDLHNEKRRELCSKNGSCTHPDLQWSDKLARECTAYAQELLERNNLEHSGAANVGENLYMGMRTGSLTAATRCWLGEEKDYHGQPIDEGLAKYGHYTQCVWPGSREVGMGMAKGRGGKVVVVARYSPQGNYVGESAWTS